MRHIRRMIESSIVAPNVSAAARALRAIPSEKRTAASRKNLAKASEARRENVEARRYLSNQLPRFHRPDQIIKATGVPYDPIRAPLPRWGFVRLFDWIESKGDVGYTRKEVALLVGYHIRPTNLARFVRDALYHLKLRRLVTIEGATTRASLWRRGRSCCSG